MRTGIDLSIGREAVLDLTLAIGEVSDEVTVTGDAPFVDTTTSTISGLADGNTIRALPLNGRDAAVERQRTLAVGESGDGGRGRVHEGRIAGHRDFVGDLSQWPR